MLKGLFRRDPLEAGEDMYEAVEDAMSALARDRVEVRKFFDHPEVAYVRKSLKW